MTSATRAFFVGVGTTLLIAGVAFGGGLMFGKNMMEPTPPAPTQLAARQLPPARVVLPTLTEAAAQPAPAAPAQQEAAFAPPPQRIAAPQPEPAAQSIKEVEATPERDKAAERAERRKADAEEREQHRRVADRKAKREAARIAKLQQRQPRQEPSIMAFGGDDGEQPRTNGGFFGN